jgi:hypothetical protein
MIVACCAKTESLGARGVSFREVYSLPEVFLLSSRGLWLWSVFLGLFDFPFPLYFCCVCGRFIGFDSSCSESICWICKSEF